MDQRFKKLKEQYMDIPLPEELDFVVNRALKKSRRRRVRSRWIASASAAFVICIAAINMNTSVANAFTSVPGLGQLVKVVTIKEYFVSDGKHSADIKVPDISNLPDDALALGLNEKYLKEGKELYEQFRKDIAADNGPLAVDAGYMVKTDTDNIFAIERYVVTATGSSSETVQYDTIDKKNQLLITLPMLFKNSEYVEAISRNLIEQMKQRMAADPNVAYFIAGEEDGVPMGDAFKQIRPDQHFYINAAGHLVVAFDKYEIAPGYMGVQEFVIPTEAISDLLISRNYVK